MSFASPLAAVGAPLRVCWRCRSAVDPKRDYLKCAEEIMEMLEAFDLTGSLRDAAELAGCSHHTVARHVAARGAGTLSDRSVPRPQLIDEFLPKLEEWMERSRGKIRGDVAHEKLTALGYAGSERTTRRAMTDDEQGPQLRHVQPDPGAIDNGVEGAFHHRARVEDQVAAVLELVDRIRVAEAAAALLLKVEPEAQARGVDPPVDDLAQAPYRPGLGQGVCDLSQAFGFIDAGEAVALLREA